MPESGAAIPDRLARGAGIVLACTAGAAFAGWLAGRSITALTASDAPAWMLGRAAGITAYLLLFVLVLLGLVLSHPWAIGLRWPRPATRLRLHAALAAFTATFTVLHIVVLATDEHAGVGWIGALVPLGSSYRPVAVTLGVLGLYSGLAAGLTASLAGRLTGRIWLPIHRFAGVSLVLVWTHSVLAGSDTTGLLWMYAVTAVLLLGVAGSRYAARSPRDRLAELTRELGTHPLSAVPDAVPERETKP